MVGRPVVEGLDRTTGSEAPVRAAGLVKVLLLVLLFLVGGTGVSL